DSFREYIKKKVNDCVKPNTLQQYTREIKVYNAEMGGRWDQEFDLITKDGLDSLKKSHNVTDETESYISRSSNTSRASSSLGSLSYISQLEDDEKRTETNNAIDNIFNEIQFSRPDISDAFIRIKYSDPIVTIGDRSNDDIPEHDISEFITVHSIITQKPPEYSKIEQLFSQLKERKGDIDHILYSQNVYAVGPDFRNDIPCIACWAAEPLDQSIMEKLSELFDSKFDVVYHLVKAVDINGSCIDNDENSNETPNKSGNVNDVLGETENNKSQCFNITAHLWASIKYDSKLKKKTLEFKIHLKNCSVEDFLSDDNPLLHGFVCYYLDSLEIGFRPTKFNDKSPELSNESSMSNGESLDSYNELFKHNSELLGSNDKSPEPNDGSLESDNESFESGDECPMIMLKEYTPSRSNNSINISKTKEKGNGIQLDAGKNPKVSLSHATKNTRSSAAALKEWDMVDTYGTTNGIKWQYRYFGEDIFNNGGHRKSIRIDEPYCGDFYINKNLGGFCITITQVLGFKEDRTIFRRLVSPKPELIKYYPKFLHKLEIYFKDIQNFNNNFAKLTKKLHQGRYLTPKKPIYVREKNNTKFKRELSSAK
ncbi:6906_t:CDS:2, partial [Racocetra persica]